MWEGALFALQILGFWIVVYWLLADAKAGGRAETGLLGVVPDARPGGAAARPGHQPPAPRRF
jgi:hypothetical protein